MVSKKGRDTDMNIIFLIFTSIFFILFLTTAVDKVIHFNKHLSYLSSYRIIPSPFIRPLLLLFIFTELFLSYSFLSINITFICLFVALGLLFTYTLAIVINLIRGNTNINCGCGSILENDRLSYGLVFRNILLILIVIVIFLIKFNIDINFDLFIRIWVIMFSCGIFMIISAIKEYNNQLYVLKFIEKLINREGEK